VEACDESWSPRSNATALAGYALTTTTTIVVQASYTRHLYELASNFDTRNLSKFLIPVFGTRLS